MPLDPKEFEKVFANHFEKISPEQFLDNLKAACPYLFEEDLIVTTDVIDGDGNSVKQIVLNDARV